MANARMIALKALLRVDEDGGYSNLVWNAALSSASLDARDAAFAGALFYGVLERRLTLDYLIGRYASRPVEKLEPWLREALRLGFYQMLYMDRVPDRAAVDETVRLVKQSKFRHLAGFANGVLRSFARDGKSLSLPPDLPKETRLSLTYSLPEWLVTHLITHYGEPNAIGAMAGFLGRRPLFLRVNTLKTDRAGLLAALTDENVTASAWDDDPAVVRVEASGDLAATQAYRAGLFHVQDPSSGLCCRALDPQPGQRVLDLCAAPGGKSFTIAQRMGDRGQVLACDLYPQKAELIRTGAQRLGLAGVQPMVSDGSVFHSELGLFDAVLCDLPCSGLGILGRKPEIRYKTVTFLDNLPQLQYGMLQNGVKYLKPGGRLIFSTCTLNPAENEQNVARLLSEHRDLSPLPILPACKRVSGEAAHFINLFPHVHGTDGFFIAAVRKDG